MSKTRLQDLNKLMALVSEQQTSGNDESSSGGTKPNHMIDLDNEVKLNI